jgi:hypothetical protein
MRLIVTLLDIQPGEGAVMRRATLLFVASSLAAALGCSDPAGKTPATAVGGRFRKVEGLYDVEVVTARQPGPKLKPLGPDGQGGAEVTWGDGGRLTIERGKLTVNGRDLGKLKESDRVRVGWDGTVTVNGEGR